MELEMKRLLLCVCVISLWFARCTPGNSSAKQKEELPELPVVQLSPTDTFLQKTYVTRIEAVRNVEVRNKVEGYLDKIYVDEGQEVRKGQLLFAVNPKEYRTDVARAKAILSTAVAEAREAEVQLERVKLLVEKDIISKSELEVAKANYGARQSRIREARSMVANANTNLGYTYIRAPFNGFIDRIPLKQGSLLSEGTLLTTVSDIASVFAYFNVAEDEYLRYLRDKLKGKNGSKDVRLKLADGSEYRHHGSVETTSSEFQSGTGNMTFRARFPNPNKILRHGGSGEVVLQTKANNILLLPQKSVFEVQDRNYVYVVGGDNKVKIKSFQPGPRVAGFYIVQAGLKPGERIVYEGTQGLKEGMQIKPVARTMREVLDDSYDAADTHSFAQVQ